MLKKKQRFTIIETIIALFLMAILLSFVFRFFAQVLVIEGQIEKAREEVFLRNDLQVWLHRICSQIAPSDFKASPLQLNKKELSAIFHNGIDINPQLGGYVKARLFLQKNELLLELTSIDDPTVRRQIPLVSKVFTINYAIEDTSSQRYHKWPKKNAKKPLLLHLKLTMENQDVFNFAFFLPTVENSIIYFKSNL